MKSLKNFLLLAVAAIAFAGCQSYGKEYKVDDKHNVYYKGDGLDEATAKKLGEYLKEQEYFQSDIKATVQITKNKDTFNLNFVVNKDKLDADKEGNFRTFGGMISKAVFGSAPVTLNLCNDHLESFKSLGYCKAEEPAPVTEEPAPDK